MVKLGSPISPFNAWLLLRGIQTLHVRVERQCKTAMALAKHLEAHPKVEANKGLVAIQRGPIVYCAEFADNDFPAGELGLKADAEFSAQYEPEFFGGVTTIRAGKMKLIPYYLYANRGKGWMRVWMPHE